MATKNKIIKANLVMPKTKKKIVWAGIYGGHYNCIVFFKSKPALSKEDYRFESDTIHGKYYDTTENKDIKIGGMWLEQFEQLYPKANLGKPKAIEIIEVFQIQIEGVFNKYGKLTSFEFHADGH